ncbi:MAG: hypothetical protein GY801_35185 [bacterium]|nr:hypothetical protein [bacterium]
MKWLAIINPRSSGKKTDAQIDHIVSQLHDVISTYTLTEYPGHAQELAHAASGFDGIVVVGGDGTLFEVLQGMDVQRQHLAILPTGTGNSLAWDLGITTFGHGIEALHDHNLISVDLMHVTFTASDGSTQQCYAASDIGLGYYANAARLGNHYFKPMGKYCYYIAGAVATVLNKPFAVHLGDHERHVEWQSLTGLFMNNGQYTADLKLFPEASLDDGHFDVMETKIGFFKQNLHNLSMFLRSDLYSPAKLWRTKSLHIDLEEPQCLTIDGELFPHILHVHVRIVPQTLTCYQRGGHPQ